MEEKTYFFFGKHVHTFRDNNQIAFSFCLFYHIALHLSLYPIKRKENKYQKVALLMALKAFDIPIMP